MTLCVSFVMKHNLACKYYVNIYNITSKCVSVGVTFSLIGERGKMTAWWNLRCYWANEMKSCFCFVIKHNLTCKYYVNIYNITSICVSVGVTFSLIGERGKMTAWWNLRCYWANEMKSCFCFVIKHNLTCKYYVNIYNITSICVSVGVTFSLIGKINKDEW